MTKQTIISAGHAFATVRITHPFLASELAEQLSMGVRV